MEVLLVQFLVLAFTGALWWLARRDLASRAASSPAPADTQDLEQLCATLEALVTDLARRLESLERQTARRHPAEAEAPLPSFAEVGALLAAPSSLAAPSVMTAPSAPLPTALPLPSPELAPAPASVPAEAVPLSFAEAGALIAASSSPPSAASMSAFPVFPANTAVQEPTAEERDPRHAPLDALLDAGITDPSEIARRTGLGRGEVDLILSLRARRAL